MAIGLLSVIKPHHHLSCVVSSVWIAQANNHKERIIMWCSSPRNLDEFQEEVDCYTTEELIDLEKAYREASREESAEGNYYASDIYFDAANICHWELVERNENA